MLELGWFSSGRDAAARDLLKVVQDAIQAGSLEARIAVVFCNREPGEREESDRFLELVRRLGYPLVAFSSEAFEPELRARGLKELEAGRDGAIRDWRLLYDSKVLRLLEPFSMDLGVLAGYMLIASLELCARYDLINLHPALPGGPKGTWQEVIWELIDRTAEQTGAMMHLVTPELDAGPPITYCSFSLREPSLGPLWDSIGGRSAAQIRALEGEDNPLFREIRSRGVVRELPLILHTLRAFAGDEARIQDKRMLDASGKPVTQGYDLTERIEREIRGTDD